MLSIFQMSSLVAMVILLLRGVAFGLPSKKAGCKCVPNQWSGLLSSVERQYDLRGGQTAMSENTMFINYDYTNKMFAMEDLTSGSIAIADYKKGYKYLIRREHCHAIETKETMRRMCLPDSSEHKGDFVLGGSDLPIEIWQFLGPANMSMRTTVLKDTCMPISEEVAMATNDYASLTSSYYFNVKYDLEKKYSPPDNCVYASMRDMKRGIPDFDDQESLKDILKNLRQA